MAIVLPHCTNFCTNSPRNRLRGRFRRPGCRQAFIKAERGGLLESRRDMAVNIEGSPHFGMAQPFLDYLWVDSLAEHQRGVGMAGIMEPVALQSSLAHYLCERATEAPGKKWRTITIAEHGSIIVDRIPLQ